MKLERNCVSNFTFDLIDGKYQSYKANINFRVQPKMAGSNNRVVQIHSYDWY